MNTASLNRRDLINAYETGTVLNVNGHSLTITSMYQNGSGEWKYDVICDGSTYVGRYLCHLRAACGLSERTSRTVTVIPKSQKVEVTANNKGATVTVRYKRSGDTDSIRQLAYSRIDTLRAEQRRMEREINLLLALTSEDSFEQEKEILQARETAANNRKRDLQARVNRLQNYIDTYAKRVGDTMLSGNIEKAQLLVATQTNRLSRAQALIAVLNNM